MAWVRKRTSDKARGKSGKWTAVWRDEAGKARSKAVSSDKAMTLKYAQEQESRVAMILAGIVDPRDERHRKASVHPLTSHLEDYRLTLVAKDDTAKHVRDVVQALTKLFADSAAEMVGDLDFVRVAQAIGRVKASRSARTANKYTGFLSAFLLWMSDAGRISEAPRWLSKIARYSVDADTSERRRVRRALTADQLEKLYAAAEQGAPFNLYRGPRRGKRNQEWIDGPTRAMIYRVAAGTGFRANEIATLTPERFDLGDNPTVVAKGCYAKNEKTWHQPISRALAGHIRAKVESTPPETPIFRLPFRTARMVSFDLLAAGIPLVVDGEVVDFHSLRASYVTNLLRRGISPGTVQKLARHSDPRLTMNIYNKVNANDLRDAVEE